MLKSEFESSSSLTPEFQTFYLTFKRDLTKELKTVGATDIQFSRGHFYVSGFYTLNGQAWYFSISDVRGMCYGGKPQLLYRTAQHYKDYTGGGNRYATIEPGMARKMHQ
jgi:hypothetical protein